MERKILPKNTKKGGERDGTREVVYFTVGDSKTNSAKICSFYRSVIATEFYIQQEWSERTGEERGKREMERIHEY